VRPNARAAGGVLVACLMVGAATGVRAAGELERAFARGDRLELGRAADRLGARGLAALLGDGNEAAASGSRTSRAAALSAVPLIEARWTLLPELVALASSPDRSIAAPAARATADLARELAGSAEELGVPVDVLADSASACALLAARAGVAPDVRVHAAECALALAAGVEAVPADVYALSVTLLSDGDPELRRAAAALADAGDPAIAEALRGVASDDPDVTVAATAAATLCRAGAPLGKAERRARELADHAATDPGDAVSLRECTRAAR
jgi:hypothetical protein